MKPSQSTLRDSQILATLSDGLQGGTSTAATSCAQTFLFPSMRAAYSLFDGTRGLLEASARLPLCAFDHDGDVPS